MKHIILTTIALMGLVSASNLHAQTAAPAKPGQLVNGDFSQTTSAGMPTGWSYTHAHSNLAASKGDNKIPDGVTITTIQEGSKAIVRIIYKNNRGGCIAQVVEVPPKSKEARLKVSVRGAPDVEGARYGMPDVGLRFFNAQGKLLPSGKTRGPKQLSDKSWQEVDFSIDVPPGATSCDFILGNANNTNGTFDFRGASVKFR